MTHQICQGDANCFLTGFSQITSASFYYTMRRSTVGWIILSIILLIALILCTWNLVLVLGKSSYFVTEAYLEQKQDHFEDGNNNTWKQQYFVDTSKWGGPGYPAFLLLGGEWDITYSDFQKPWCKQYASEFKALCFILEHR